MAISIPTILTTYVSTGDINTSTKAVGTSVAAGAMIIVSVGAGSSAAAPAVSDSKGNTWNAGAVSSTASTPANTTNIFYSKITNALTATDTITVTRDTPNGSLTWSAQVVFGASGAIGANPIANGNSATSSTAAISADSGSLVLYVLGTGVNESLGISPDNSFITLSDLKATGGNNPRRVFTAYRTSSTSQSIAPAADLDYSLGWSMAAIEFLPVTTTPTTFKSWSGNGLAAGALTTSSAGTGDIPFDALVGTGQSIVTTGSRSPQIQLDQASGVESAVRWNFTAQTQGAFRLYWTTPSTWGANSISIARLYSGSSSNPLQVNVMTNGTMRLLAIGGVQVAATGSGVVQNSTRYRIEGRMTQNGTSGFAEVAIYLGDSTTALATISGTADYGTSHDNVRFGNSVTTPTMPSMQLDDLAVTDVASFIGPYGGGGGAVTPPDANFTANVTSGTAPLTVQFTDTSLYTPTSWLWSFTETDSSIQQNPTFTFTEAGSYQVSLLVNNQGGSDTETKVAYINVSSPQAVGAILKSWSGDGLTAGTLTTSSAGNGDAPFDSLLGTGQSIVATGTRSPQIELTQAANTACAVRWDFPSQAQGAFRFYWTTPSAWGASSISIARLYTASTNPLQVNVMTNGTMRLLAIGGTQIATTASGVVQNSTRYRIEGRITHNGASGFAEIAIYAGDSTTAVAIISGTGDYDVNHNNLRIGNSVTTPTLPTMQIDDLAVSSASTFIGPYTGSSTAVVAKAGSDQTVEPWSSVTLDGSSSTGAITSYSWLQTAGQAVTLTTGSGSSMTMTLGTSTTSVADPDTSGVINENSGLVVSKKNSTASGRVFWGHNDTGGDPTVYAFDDLSPYTILGSYTLGGATNQDWEDISLGPGPDPAKSYLYVGDIGSGAGTMRIYRIEEPSISLNQAAVTTTISSALVDTFSFSRPAGTNDSEGFFVDPVSGDIILFQKKGGSVNRPEVANVYRIAAAQLGAGSRTVTTELIGSVRSHDQTTNNGGITAADISEDGRFFAVCNYQEVWVWSRDVAGGETIAQAITTNPVGPGYQYFPTGWGSESLAFDKGTSPKRIYTMAEGASAGIKYITMTSSQTVSPSSAVFEAPASATSATLTFRLTVSDGTNNSQDTVSITVLQATEFKAVAGSWTPIRLE